MGYYSISQSITELPRFVVGTEEGNKDAEFLPLDTGNLFYKGRDVQTVLTELFQIFSPTEGYTSAKNYVPGGYKKFLEDGEFIVPDNVTKVLVLCIGAGGPTSSTRGGGMLVSRMVDVIPGETIPVKVGIQLSIGSTVYNNPTNMEKARSKFGDKIVAAACRYNYSIDGTDYTFSTSTGIPENLKDKIVTIGTCAASATSSSRSRGTPGTGGYAVAKTGFFNERAAWLELAREMPVGTSPAGRTCYPDTTQLAGNYSRYTAGVGANYGGCGGCWALGSGYSRYGALGGKALVLVFWGDDIDKEGAFFTSKSYLGIVESDKSLTPLITSYDVDDIHYVNEEAGLTGNTTVKDALDKLYSLVPNPAI